MFSKTSSSFLSIKHDKLKNELEVLENKVESININKHKSTRKNLQSKINRVKNKRNKLIAKKDKLIIKWIDWKNQMKIMRKKLKN